LYINNVETLKSGHARIGEKVIIDVDAMHFEAKVVPTGFYDKVPGISAGIVSDRGRTTVTIYNSRFSSPWAFSRV